MSAISGIQSVSSPFERLQNRRVTAQQEAVTNKNYGPDTVTISDEARAMLAQNGAVEETLPEKISRPESSAANSAAKITRKSVFAMLMESLLLAEMEEAGAGAEAKQAVQADGTVQDVAPQDKKSVNPLQDGEKVANLKKVINDFMSGKADISDLPQAMAVGKAPGSKPGAFTKIAEPERVLPG